MELAIDFLNATTIGVASLIFLLCLFLYGRPLKNVNGSSKEAPTVAGAWPIFGHLPLLIGSKSPHKALGALAEKYGPLFTIKLGAKKALVVNDWEMARECFTTNDVAVSARPKLLVAELMCYNNAMLLVAPYGPYWRELRKIIVMEILSPSRVEQLQDVRVSEVQNSIVELYDVWRSQKNESDYASVELKQWFAQPIFNMVLRMVVGKRFLSATATDEKAEKCVKAVDEFMRLAGVFTVGDAIPYLRWFDFGGYEKAMKETAKELDVMISEWLEEHRQKRALGEGLDGAQDFMNVMLSSLDGKTIDGVDADTLIKSTVLLGVLSSFNQSIARLVPGLTIIQAGTEASITTIIWAMCLILKNPLILEKIKEELDIQVGKDRCLCESDISNLVYLQAVVKETFRLYAPGPLSSPREFAEDCTLGGYHVKKGTRLITNIWKIHTDPNVWPDPFEFKPDRFLTTHKDIDVKGHHFQLLPFGSGRRVCPGISFGLQTVHLTLASFLHSFEILNPSTEHLDMTEAFGVTNTKATPLEVLIKPRLSPSCYKSM